MANYTGVTNNFENVTTLKEMLAVPNANTGGYAYVGLMIMMQVIILISLLPFGFEAAILGSAFIALIASLFLAYLELISFSWLMFFMAQILIMIIYITWQKRNNWFLKVTT